jgi:hypothetical protein
VAVSEQKEKVVEKIKKPTFIRKIKKSFVLDEYSPIAESNEDGVEAHIDKTIVLDVEEIDKLVNNDNEIVIIKRPKKKAGPHQAVASSIPEIAPQERETLSLALEPSASEPVVIKKKRVAKEGVAKKERAAKKEKK